MKYSACAVVALSLALSACNGDQTRDAGSATSAPSDTQIDVKIVGGKIVVADITYSEINHGAVKWTISGSGNYTFPRDGIVIDPGSFACPPNQAGSATFRCIKRGHKPSAQFKYIVNVNSASGPLEPLDPYIYNR